MKQLLNKSKLNQQGLVSIIVTVLIMLILSLIVLGFAQLVRREQRQSLDRQLSTQAFYAAETGINDAVEAYNNDLLTEKKTDCSDIEGYDNQLDAEGSVMYTCVLFDPEPEELEITQLTDEPEAFPVSAADSANDLTSITFRWETAQTSGNNETRPEYSYTGCPNSFPHNWVDACDAGVLRVDIVSAASQTRAALLNNTFTAFFRPSGLGSAGSINFTDAIGNQAGAIERSRCNTPANDRPACVATVTLPGNSSKYFVRVSSIYRTSRLEVTARSAVNTNEPLSGAQAIVDSTGKAADVLRRIRVRVRLTPGDETVPTASHALQLTDGFCKRFGIIPSRNQVLLGDGGDNMCNPLEKFTDDN